MNMLGLICHPFDQLPAVSFFLWISLFLLSWYNASCINYSFNCWDGFFLMFYVHFLLSLWWLLLLSFIMVFLCCYVFMFLCFIFLRIADAFMAFCAAALFFYFFVAVFFMLVLCKSPWAFMMAGKRQDKNLLNNKISWI